MFFMGFKSIKILCISDINHVQNLIRNYPDFPKQGILFKDIILYLGTSIFNIWANIFMNNLKNCRLIMSLGSKPGGLFYLHCVGFEI